jgi:hypothetical protein
VAVSRVTSGMVSIVGSIVVDLRKPAHIQPELPNLGRSATPVVTRVRAGALTRNTESVATGGCHRQTTILVEGYPT